MTLRTVVCTVGLVAIAVATHTTVFAQVPTFDHVVVVIEENKSYSEIIGNPAAPVINALATAGASFTNAFAIEHPSQPNYLDLYSGSNQGITNNGTPGGLPFSTPNIGASLIAAGYSFAGYSESMPSVGFTGDSFTNNIAQNQYMRKHNPWVNWQDDSSIGINNHLASTTNQPFTSFPSNFNLLPTFSFVVPNEQNDMHDGSIAAGDSWFSANIGAYATWASTHNSLLIVLWDEDDYSEANHIALIFSGAKVKMGQYGTATNLFDLLRTFEDMYKLPYAGASANGRTLSEAFTQVPEPSGWVSMSLMAGLGGAMVARRRLRKSPNR